MMGQRTNSEFLKPSAYIQYLSVTNHQFAVARLAVSAADRRLDILQVIVGELHLI